MEQVQHDLLQLHAIAANGGRSGASVEAHRHAAERGLVAEEPDDVQNQRVEIERRPVELILPQHAANALDDVAGRACPAR